MAFHLANVSYLIEYEYLAIAGLPGEIIELMKEPAKRSELVKELLKGMPVTGTDNILRARNKIMLEALVSMVFIGNRHHSCDAGREPTTAVVGCR